VKLTEEQTAVLAQVISIPGAVELIQSAIVSELMSRFQEDIESDPTIENPEAVFEILGRGAGYIGDLVVTAQSLVEGVGDGS
jgi:hypothetical protein